MDDADERRCLLALHLTPALGAVRIRRLVDVLGSAAAACEAGEAALSSVPGIGVRLAAQIVRGRRTVEIDRELCRAAAVGARILTWLDVGYPERLRGLRDAPPVVYVRGGWGDARSPAVGIVGTRRPSPYGVRIAAALGEALGEAGVVVVSGLARGIDKAAHAGALRAGAATVGVLGCGVDVVYPPEHRNLMEAMLKRGGVISEMPMGRRPRPQQFPPRNRLISGLAQAVVVVEGSVDSGSLITARHAAFQGRQVFAVPGSIFAAASRGPHRLLAQGARLLQDPGDLLQALDLPRPARPERGRGARLTGDEVRVLDVLGDHPVHIDRIIERAGLSAGQVAGALAALEVCGLVHQSAGKRFARWPELDRAKRQHAGGDTWPNHSSS